MAHYGVPWRSIVALTLADLLSLHRDLREVPPFGSRSMFDRSPFVLRSSFVAPSFQVRSALVPEAGSIEQVTDQETLR